MRVFLLRATTARHALVALGLATAALAPRAALAQDWKGMGRIEGRVVDPDGKPVADATVKLELPSRGGGPTVKTDKKGRWAVGGIAAGRWNVDVDAPGFATSRGYANLATESDRLPPVEIKLERAAPKGPPPEVLEAIRKGDEAYKAGRFADARAEYEKLFTLRPDLSKTLHEQIARCYSQEGNYAKELEHLQVLLDADPADQNVRLLMAQEALKGGLLDRGRELLKGVDQSAIKDPNVYFNIAALLLNQQKTEEAIGYLDRAIALDPAYVDGYFQRGLSYIGLGKVAEARADLRKVIELAPGTPQAETAKKALEQLK
jgi:tetratricopeptide (TPR) repeat protein